MFQRKAIAPRATVRPDFMNALIGIYRERYDSLAARIRAGQRGEDIKMQVRSLKAFLSSEDVRNRTAIKLAGLPYEEFGYNSKDGQFLYGKTRPIIMDAYTGEKIIAKYDMGPYYVIIPFATLNTGPIEEVHLVPARNMRISARHPHHWAKRDDGPITSWEVHTCLGSFATLLTSVRNIGDIPEFFRIWHIYLSRYDIHSPLRTLVRNTWRDVDEELAELAGDPTWTSN